MIYIYPYTGTKSRCKGYWMYSLGLFWLHLPKLDKPKNIDIFLYFPQTLSPQTNCRFQKQAHKQGVAMWPVLSFILIHHLVKSAEATLATFKPPTDWWSKWYWSWLKHWILVENPGSWFSCRWSLNHGTHPNIASYRVSHLMLATWIIISQTSGTYVEHSAVGMINLTCKGVCPHGLSTVSHVITRI